MASHTLSLAPRRVSNSTEPLEACAAPAPLFLVPACSKPKAPRPEGPQLLASGPRGLHLVTEAHVSGLRPVALRPADSLARARSIVAQVEWEVAQQASRRPNIARLVPTAINSGSASFKRDTPIAVLRRLFHAFAPTR